MPKDHKEQKEKKDYICTTSQGRQWSQIFAEKNSQTNESNKWIRKENWLIQIGFKNI